MKQHLKNGVRLMINPIERFLNLESSGGILLILCTAIAIIWVNSGYEASYHHLWEQKLSIGFGNFAIDLPLHIWINDLLMAVFFFYVGLEIKREMLAGELSSIKEAAMPIAAAIGGMVFPAAIFLIIIYKFNGGIGHEGWGVPMATDIAFSIGILTLLGKRVPVSIKVFLTALAIVDDLGAVLVIALFYSSDMQINYLLYATPLLGLLALFNYLNFRKIPIYILVGMVMWYLFLKSGIHPTVCGVIVAFTIPARRKINLKEFLNTTKAGLAVLESTKVPPNDIVLDTDQIDAIYTMEEASDKVQSPLQRIENTLHEWVIHFIMPVFALANAAVVFESNILDSLFSPISLAVAIALLIGKCCGITLFSWISVKLGIAALPTNTSWKEIFGVSILAGIGFTMSLFVSNLAFSDPHMIDQAKIGIFFGSIMSGFIGFFVLKSVLKKV
jgi:NhaA family Na+:H+ antiporter